MVALCNDRKQKFNRFINYYNTAKTHKMISEKMPYEFLEDYFNNEVQITHCFSAY